MRYKAYSSGNGTRLLLMLGFVAEERNFLQYGDELDRD